jgi:hypothetical protein
VQYTQKELKKIAEESCAKLLSVKNNVNFFEKPFKHLYVDNFFPLEFAEMCLRFFPEVNATDWDAAKDDDIEVKFRTKWESEFDSPDGIVSAVRILNSSIFLNAMSVAMGIAKIVPDPYFSGGGLNVTNRGGLLDVHVDGNYHDASGLNRRLNAILYLNHGWENSWGGEFGLYDETGDNCVKKIAPLFNRLVIFDSNDKSFHGLPDPVKFPLQTPRRSIILYYYTKELRPADQTAVAGPHSALWKKRNLRDKRGNLTRDFD